MAGGKLEVQIGADITDFEKKIKEVEFDIKELSKVKLDKLRLGLDTTTINAQIKDAKNNLNSLRTTVKDTGGAIGGQFAKQTGNGSNALMQFSRIAQDAPYGIIGIGNNITATVEAFGHLKNQTGTTGGALKAMASSIMGSGGILLGVSLLTTGLTLLAQSGLSVGDIIDKVTGKFNEFGGAIKKASEEGVKATAGEVFGLKALVSASQNKALSDKDRLIAVENLQKQYPGYFGNLSKEQIMTSNLTGVVNELTKALVARATAEKLAGASADIQLSIYKKNAELIKQKEQTLKLEKELSLLVGNSTKDELYADNQKLIAVTNLNGQIINSKSLENEYRTEILKGTKAIEQRQNVINQLTASSLKLEQQQTGGVKKIKAPNITPQVTGLDSKLIPSTLVPLIIPAVNSEPFAKSLKTLAPFLTDAQINMELALLDFNDRASDIINGALMDTFAGIGNALGNALSTGGNVLNALGTTLLDSLGGVLTSMGKMAIEVGVGLLGIKLALKTLNPYAAIGAGVALVALGAMFSSKSKSLGGSTGGGGGSRASSSTGSGANNSSFSGGGFSSAGSNGGTVVFEIAGQKLIGVLSNTLNANQRLGGQTTFRL